MTFDDQEILSRFHRALVRQIYARNPDHLESPFTVAEIYQNLVPYRTHRDEIGVEMNADYEHALLRLLAGEGDFLTLESRTARQEIQEELDSANPNTGMYRDFAAADVRLNPDYLREDMFQGVVPAAPTTDSFDDDITIAEDDDEDMEDVVMDEGFDAANVPDEGFEKLEVEPLGAGLEPLEDDLSEEELDSEAVEVEVSGETDDLEMVEEVVAEEDAASEEDLPPFENCPWCREDLPQQARVRFCPFCGSNVQLRPCPACGEELRLNWRFCIACGTEVES
jgi:hypothetical protein